MPPVPNKIENLKPVVILNKVKDLPSNHTPPMRIPTQQHHTKLTNTQTQSAFNLLKRAGFALLLLVSIPMMLGNSPCQAQFDIVWQRIYGSADQNYPGRAIELSTGNILVAGTVAYFEPTSDFEVTLFSSSGDSLSTEIYGGTLSIGAYDLFRLIDNRCIVAGYGVSEDTGETEFLVMSTTSAGHLEQVGEVFHDDNDILRDGSPTSNNQFLLAGQTEGGPSAIDFFVARLDSELRTSWMRRIANVGASRDEANCIVEMDENSIFVGGATTRLSFPANQNMYVVKLNSQGDSLWSLEFGDEAWEEIMTMERLNDHQLVMAANYYFDGNSEILVTCMDTSGSICWQTPVGLPEIEELTSDILVTATTILVLGTRTGFNGIPVILLAAMDFQGDTLWTRTISGEVGLTANSIEKTANGDFIICGTTYSMAIPPQADAVLMRIALTSSIRPEHPELPNEFHLSAFPNPFNSTTTLRMDLPIGTRNVKLTVTNVLGQTVEQREIEVLAPRVDIQLSLDNHPSGIYLARVESLNKSQTTKLVLLK